MEKFITIILSSILIEAITTYIKSWFVDRSGKWQQIVTCFFGIFFAIAYNLDLLGELGLTSQILYVGNILTGIILSRGANYTWDIVKRLNGYMHIESVKDLQVEADKQQG